MFIKPGSTTGIHSKGRKNEFSQYFHCGFIIFLYLCSRNTWLGASGALIAGGSTPWGMRPRPRNCTAVGGSPSSQDGCHCHYRIELHRQGLSATQPSSGGVDSGHVLDEEERRKHVPPGRSSHPIGRKCGNGSYRRAHFVRPVMSCCLTSAELDCGLGSGSFYFACRRSRASQLISNRVKP